MKPETMTDEQIEKAAQEHADELRVSSAIPGALVPMLHDIAKSSYVCGAQDALQNQWVSVKERLPEEGTMVTAHSPNGRMDVLKYHDGEFADELGQAHCVDYFIPIPQLNPEKQERL